MSKISDFRGEYRWLSNFHLVEVELDGLRFPSTEHAYQAAKTLDIEERRAIQALSTCRQAKRAGQRLKLVEGNTWGDRFWGVCGGVGLNWLGRLLMQVRDEVR